MAVGVMDLVCDWCALKTGRYFCCFLYCKTVKLRLVHLRRELRQVEYFKKPGDALFPAG
jgi:hypothetical protein